MANQDWALAHRLAEIPGGSESESPGLFDVEDPDQPPGDGHGLGSDDEPPNPGLYIAFQGPNNCSCEPPDPILAVGTNHVLLAINDQLRAVNKATGATVWSVSFETFFASVNPGGLGTSDPRVVFDPVSQRYFVIILYIDNLQMPTRSWWMLAASTSSDITDPTSTWRKWAFDPTIADSGRLADYPALGFDNDAIYITSNMFSGNTATVDLAVIPKTQLLINTPSPVFTQIVNIKNANNTNAFTLQPCLMYGTTANCFLVNADFGSSSSIYVYQVNTPLTTPTLTRAVLNVASYMFPPDAAQAGSSNLIATGDDRLQNAVWRNNSLWTTHAIGSNSLCSARWYQIGTSNWPSPSLIQSGTYNSGGAHYCYPSVAVDSLSNMAMGFTRTRSNEFASAWHATRLAADPAGTLGPPVEDHAGLRDYTGTRWGDFSGTVVDPVDDLTFWTVQEFAAAASGSWSTWCTSFVPLTSLSGACCHNNQTCTDNVAPAGCLGAGDVFHPGETCLTACPATSGACCTGGDCGGNCSILGATQCTAAGGSYAGDNTTCATSPCQFAAPTGSCIISGACSVLTHAACNIADGLYGGDCTQCNGDLNPTPATGACCSSDGSCAVTTQANCAGTWKENGACDPNPCPQPTGACCVKGKCSLTTEVVCSGQGGQWQGAATNCDAVTCPCQTGLCGICIAQASLFTIVTLMGIKIRRWAPKLARG
jgi:hypothetical protein